MSQFVTNPVDFSAECATSGGRCVVVRENIVFVDDEGEPTAIAQMQMKCGHVVITPDPSDEARALLYHTSCRRMADVVDQIFQDSLDSPTSLSQHHAEMTVGELYRRHVAIPYEACKVKVEEFAF